MSRLLDGVHLIKQFHQILGDLPHKCSKSTWGKSKGTWHNEPEMVIWLDKKTNYFCLARRNMITGIWNGYVVISSEHPCYFECLENLEKIFSVPAAAYQKRWQKDKSIPLFQPISYAASEETGIFLIGFDNLGSSMPIFGETHDEYVPLKFVKMQCEFLAKQLKKKEKENVKA